MCLEKCAFMLESFLIGSIPLRLKIAQKHYIVWSLGPKALKKCESFEP